MTQQIRYLVLIFLVSACGRGEVLLVDNNWILIGGMFEGRKIDFKSTDRIFLTDQNGEVIHSFNFSEDQTIILPGINSNNISARWTIEENKIHFSIDSMRYPFSTFDPSIFKTGDTTENKTIINGLEAFKEPMRVYGQAFEYNISRDTLRLFSKDVKLWAVRDRRIDDLLKNL
jgi:hypothetical protein